MENFGYLFAIGSSLVLIFRWQRALPGAVAHAHELNEQFLLRNAVADGTDPRRSEAALARLTRHLERHPADVISYLLRATVYHTRGETSEAIDDYSQVLRLQPSHVVALMNRATLWRASGQYDAAIADLSHLLDMHPRTGDALLLRAKAHSQAGRRDDAIADIERTGGLTFSNRGDRLRRIQLWVELRHDLEGCEAELSRELEREPESVAFRYLRGSLRSAAGRTTDAREDFEFVANHADESRDEATYRAHAQMNLRRWSEAAAEFAALLESDPDDHAARKHLAWALLSLGEVDRSLAEWHELVRGGGASAEDYVQRGNLLADSGHYHEASEDFRAALRLDPDCVNALNCLAWLLSTCPSARFRSGPEAVKLATQACERTDWESDLTLGTLGAALAECGRFDEAIRREQEAQDRMSPALLSRWGFLLDRYRAGEPYRSSPGEYIRELRLIMDEVCVSRLSVAMRL